MLCPTGRASRSTREGFCRSVFVVVRFNTNRPRFGEQATHLFAAHDFSGNARASRFPVEASPAVSDRLNSCSDSFQKFAWLHGIV